MRPLALANFLPTYKLKAKKNKICLCSGGLPRESSVCVWAPDCKAARSLEGENSLEDQRWSVDKWRRLSRGHLPLDLGLGPLNSLNRVSNDLKKVIIS